MATVSQPGPPQQQQQQQPQPPPTNDSLPPALSWEGEKMFNIYIYDYCFKRGFRKTARELMSEAEIAPDSTPPINARQGLLFEWWSVFWVLFTAKANGSGTEEAMLYTQHQASQTLQRQASQRLQPTGQSLHGAPPQPGMPHQQPPAMARLANGRPGPGMVAFMPNGHMTNGIGPQGGGNGGPNPNTFSIGGSGVPQPNGIIAPPPGSQGPGQGGPSSAPGPGQGFQLRPGGIPQGPPQQGQQQQQPGQRGPPNPNGPFPSPTMAGSPQNAPPGSGHPQTPQQQQQQQLAQQQQQGQQPMGQLGGPSPHLAHLTRGGMLPPNQGMNPMGLGPQPGQQGAAPPGSQGYAQQQGGQIGRSPSRAGTPGGGQGGMMHPSPSMGNRQPPAGGMSMGGMGGVGGMGAGPMVMSDSMLNSQIMAIPQVVLAQLKQELGMGDKDLSTFTAQDKNRLLNAYRLRHVQQQGKPGQDNANAGPSNPMMQPPGQQGQQRVGPQQRGPGPQQGQPGPQGQQGQQRAKRNSTSPGEEHENLPRNESSPPDRKRPRRSPMEQPAVPTMNNFPHGAPLQQGPPQQMMNMGPQGMMVRAAPPVMGGMNGPPMQGGMMGGLGGMGMQGGPGPQGMQGGPGQGQGMHGMGPQMGHPGGVTPHMQHQQMQAQREQMMRNAMLAKNGGGPGNAASPSSSDPTSFNIAPPQGGGGPSFGPGASRMGQKASMMPPPSPGMGGPPKDPNQNPSGGGPGAPNTNGSGKNPNQPVGMPANHSSPRNPPPSGNGSNAGHTPNANGTGPPTPGPQNPNPAGQPGGLGGPQNMAPSPSAILGGGANGGAGQPMNNGSMGGQLDMGGNIFGADWINGVANGLEDFGDINFERDFGQWFNPDDVSGLDGMK